LATRKRVKQATTRRRAVRFSLNYDKKKWVITAAEIKEIREQLKGIFCPVSLDEYESTGMKQAVLDHQHDEDGLVRGVLSSRSNIWEGRCWKYFKKLFKDKPDSEYPDFLIRLGEYLKQEPQSMLHGAIIEAEKRRVSKWKNETLHNKLVMLGLDMQDVSEYTKHQLVELWLNEFIKQKEGNLCA